MTAPSASDEPLDLYAITMRDIAFGGDAEPSGVQQALADQGSAPTLAEPAIGTGLAKHGRTWSEEAGPRYAIIGSGNTGQVWTATDRTLMRQVAIKALASGRSRQDHLAAFIAEARLTASLQHPHVPPVHDLVVAEDGQPCFIMKAVEGMTLGAALRQAGHGETPSVIATTNGVISSFMAICQAVTYAHHQGIIHQDIKPDNILLGRFGEVLLLDWGCARRRDDREAHIQGTPYYMSPEQARREISDEMSDVYCVGASLFHALIRRPPLDTRPEKIFWDLKRRGVIDHPNRTEAARVPPPLLAIVLKALDANRSRRYQSMDALLADLTAYQAGLAVAAHRDTLWHAWRRWAFRHRTTLIAGLVVLLSLGVAGLAILQERARERARWLPVASDDFSGGSAAAAPRWILKRSSLVPTWSRQPFVAIGPEDEADGVVDGHLEIGRFATIVNAVWSRPLAGDLRVEWTCTPLVNGLNLNCFLGEDRRTGVNFQVGSWGDARYCAIFRNDTEMIDYTYLDHPAEVGKPCAFTLERESGRVRLSFNGEWILQIDALEAGDVMSPVQFGLDAYNESRLAIDEVRIFARPLPERISPIAIGGRLLRLGLFAEARGQFLELAFLRSDDELGAEASFHAAVCLARLEDPGADAELVTFIGTHPGHALVAQARFERYVLAEKAGQREAIDARCQELVGTPDPRLRQRLVSRLGNELREGLGDRAYDSYGSLQERAAFIDYLGTEGKRIHELARSLNVRVRRNDLLEDIVEHLRAAGQPRFALDLCPSEAPERVKCLVDLGQLDDALTTSVHLLNELALVQEALGLFTEMTASPRHKPKLQGWFRLGDFDALTREDPWGEYLGNTIIDRDLPEVVADDERWPTMVRARAWARLGRWQAIADDDGSWSTQQVEGLCRVGRGDEAAVRFRWDTSSLGLVAAYRLLSGDEGGCRALVAEMETTPPNHVRRSSLFGHYLVPIVLRARLKDPDPIGRLRELEDWQRAVMSQRLVATVVYLTGTADEAAFRRQPSPLCLDSQLLIAQAIQAELAGKPDDARALWRKILAMPSSQLLEPETLLPIVSVLAEEPPLSP